MKKEIIISKEIENILSYYSKQKSELENKFQEVVRAEQVILKQVIEMSDLDKGEYALDKREDGLYIILVENNNVPDFINQDSD